METPDEIVNLAIEELKVALLRYNQGDFAAAAYHAGVGVGRVHQLVYLIASFTTSK